MAVMGEPAKQGGCHFHITEHLPNVTFVVISTLVRL